MSPRTMRGIGAALWFASALCAQTSPAGHWEGVLNADGREIGLSLDLARNDKAEWIASMGVPAQNATGLVVKDVVVNGASVKFMAVELQMAKLDLTLGEGKLAGTITGPRGSLPIEFKRSGEAKDLGLKVAFVIPNGNGRIESDFSAVQGPGKSDGIRAFGSNQIGAGDQVLSARYGCGDQNSLQCPGSGNYLQTFPET